MSKTLHDEVMTELMDLSPLFKEEVEEETDSLSQSKTMATDVHMTEVGANSVSDPVVVAQPQYVRAQFLMSQNQSFVQATLERSILLHAEEEAGDATLKQFKPATRGLKGYVKRKKDESELERIKKETGDIGLDLYTMRINQKLLAEKAKDADRKPEDFSQKVEKALSWNLSWQMLSPRYLYYNAEKIHDIQRTYRELRAQEGANDAFLQTLPAEKAASYEAIMNMTGIFLTAFEQKMTLGGVNMTTGEYEIPSDDFVVHSMNELKDRFEAERKKAIQSEAPISHAEQERQTRNEQLMPKAQKIVSGKTAEYEKFFASFHKELAKSRSKDENVVTSIDRSLTGLLQGISKFEKLSMKDAVKIYKGLSIAGFSKPDDIPIEKLVEFRKAAEVVIRVLLSIDMSQFRFDSDEDLTSEDINKKLAMLNFGMELGFVINSYDILQREPVFRGRDHGCSLAPDLVQEAKARKLTLEQISGVYMGRLRLLASPSYSDFSDEEIASMTAEEAGMESVKAGSRFDQERAAMFNNLFVLKTFQDFSAGTDPNTLLQKNRVDLNVTPNIAEWLETERVMRSMPEDELKKKMESKIDAMFTAEKSDQEKIRKASELFLVISHSGNMSFMRTNKSIRKLLEKGNDWVLEDEHINADFLRKEEEVRQGLMDELYAKYEQMSTIPVPAQYLKDGVEATDPEAMKQFAALSLRSDELALRIGGIQGMITPLLMSGEGMTMSDGSTGSLKTIMNSLDFQHQQAVGDDVTTVLNTILTDKGRFNKLNDKAIADSKVNIKEKIQFMSESFMIDLMRDQ